MMKVFIDSDIFMDIFFHREPFYDDSATILDMVVEKRISGITSPIIIANLYYLTRKNKAAQLRVIELLDFIIASTVNHSILVEAFSSEFEDKEDAIQYFSAVKSKAKFFLTRNIKDHKCSTEIEVMTPAHFLKSIK